MDKNTTVAFPAPLMSTIAELGEFIRRESEASAVTWRPQSSGLDDARDQSAAEHGTRQAGTGAVPGRASN